MLFAGLVLGFLCGWCLSPFNLPKLLGKLKRKAKGPDDSEFFRLASVEEITLWTQAGCPRTKEGWPDFAAVVREQHVQRWAERCPDLPVEFLRYRNSHGLLSDWVDEMTDYQVKLIKKDLPDWLSKPRPYSKKCRVPGEVR